MNNSNATNADNGSDHSDDHASDEGGSHGHHPLQGGRRGEPLDLTADATTIENSFVGDGSKAGYISRLVLLTIWLFDHDIDCLADANIADLQAKDAADKRLGSRKARERRPGLRKLIKSLIEGITVDDDGHHNCPIKIDGDGAIKYQNIRDYMLSKKNLVKVNKQLARQYKAVDGEEEAEIDDGNEETVDAYVLQSASSYEGVRSAIAYLYRISKVERPAELQSQMSQLLAGSKRTGRKEKQGLALKISEGKKRMTKEVYSFIAKKLFESDKPEHLFAHLFLLLDW